MRLSQSESVGSVPKETPPPPDVESIHSRLAVRHWRAEFFDILKRIGCHSPRRVRGQTYFNTGKASGTQKNTNPVSKQAA
jgi:hypothetical protein